MADEPKKSEAPKGPPSGWPAEPTLQPTPLSAAMQTIESGTKNFAQKLKESYQNYQGTSPVMRFDRLGREGPPFQDINKPHGIGGVPGGGSGAMVLPLQAVKGLRQQTDPFYVGRIPSMVGNVFKNRKLLKEQWKDVGGPGPTNVKHLGAGKDMEALTVTPQGGGAEDVLKLAADPKYFIVDSRIDPRNLQAPFLVPTKMGVAPNVLWFQQPKILATKDVTRKTPQQLGFDPRESARKMLQQEAQSPWEYTDRVDFNVGFTPQGELKVLDVGSVAKRYGNANRANMPPPQVHPQDISNVLGVNYPHNLPAGAAPAQPIHISSRPSPSGQMQLPSSWPQPTRPISTPSPPPGMPPDRNWPRNPRSPRRGGGR